METLSKPKYVMCIDAHETRLKEVETYAVKTIVEVREGDNIVPKYSLVGYESALYDVRRFVPLMR